MVQLQSLLVVDDSEAEREIMTSTLSAAFPGAAIQTAPHPFVAKAMCEQQDFDCVLTDYNMPDMDGVTLASELRSASAYLPIILMTSVGDEMLAAEALREGISDYIPKSRITTESIRRTIERSVQFCGQARLVDEQRGELENFAYALAHDFKQPIRQISTFTRMISEEIQGGEVSEVHEHLAFLGDAARRLGKLVDVMSQYTLLNQPPELGDVDLNLVLASVRASLAPYLGERRANLVTPRRAPMVRGNETLMTQVIQNLVMNGLQYNRSGVPRIDVTAHQGLDHWILQIRDNGVGIEAQHLIEIFKPLIRLHTAAEYPGSGLGLTLARKAVIAQNGAIWCESKPGEGSVFHVRLPASERRRSRRRQRKASGLGRAEAANEATPAGHPVDAGATQIRRPDFAPSRASNRPNGQAWVRLLEEVANIGSWSLDVATHTVTWSDGLLRLYGFEIGDAPDLELVRAAIHPDDLGRVDQLLVRAVEFGEDYVARIRLKRPDREWRVFTSRAICERGESGAVAKVFCVVTDATAAEALEAELLEKRVLADAAMNAKAEFLNNMTHEIRTPLTAIIGFSGMLDGLPALPTTAKKYVERISTACASLMRVVNDVLDFSRLDAGKIKLDPQPVDLVDLVTETVRSLGEEAAMKDLALETCFSSSLPEWVSLDARRVRQVLLNLISNAIKFTEAGSIKVTLARLGEGVLNITVTDTGPGIAVDLQGKLFERFSQLDGSLNRNHGGMGLGLAISKGLVELMEGAIGVRSVPGLGSTFWFTFGAPSVHQPRVALDVDGSELQSPIHILVVDDVAVNRLLVRAMLEPLGHTVEEAVNGHEAVEAAMRRSFDLILMDIQMPGMDGLEATRTIRSTVGVNRDRPIVAVSANDLPGNVASCYAAGMNGHIAKPINPANLLLAVAKWTEASEVRLSTA